MTRLEDVLRAGIERAQAAETTDARVKALENKLKKSTKPQSEIKKREPAFKPSADNLESLRYMQITSTDTLDRATSVALEFAYSFLPAPSSKTAWILLQWIFINRFLEESKAVPTGTFSNFYVAAEQMMCYLQFSEDTEQVNWEEFVDLVDGGSPLEGGLNTGVRAPLRQPLTFSESEVVREKRESFRRFVDRTKELSARFIAYFTGAQRLGNGAQRNANNLPDGLQDPEDIVNFMQGNAASLMTKAIDMLLVFVPPLLFQYHENTYLNLLADPVIQRDINFRAWINTIHGLIPWGMAPAPLDPAAPNALGVELGLVASLFTNEEGFAAAFFSLDWDYYERVRHINIRDQFQKAKQLIGAVASGTAEARQFMFIATGFASLLRWFFLENRKRIDRFAAANGEALRVLTHTIVRKYVRGREVFVEYGNGQPGFPKDPRRNIQAWNGRLRENIRTEKNFLKGIKRRHQAAQRKWQDANGEMGNAAKSYAGILSGQSGATALTTVESVAAIARVMAWVPVASDIVTATGKVVGIVSYAVWRAKAKQAVQKLNNALADVNAIKPLLTQDSTGSVVTGLAFRRTGGAWSLDAAWNKRPRVMTRGAGGLSTFTVVDGSEGFEDNDDLLKLNTVVIPYNFAAGLNTNAS